MKRKTMLAIFTAVFTGLMLFIGCKQQEPDIYRVVFCDDDGSMICDQYIKSGSMADNPGDQIKYGHTFIGWLNENGNRFYFDTPITRDITLTAEWSKWEYTVEFDLFNSKYEYQRVEHGNTVREPEPPSQEGYTFEGWYNEDGIPFDFLTPITSNITLTAHWFTHSYTVTFDSNGGSYVSSQIVKYGNTAESPELPVKEGFTFAGWYTEDGINFNFVTPITSNITLTAHWFTRSYTVTFDSNGGSYVSTQYVEHGHRAERPEPPVPGKDGFTFEGWYTTDGGWFDFNTSITRNITLTAQWYEIRPTVTFDSNGGSYVSTQSVEYGNMAEIPEPPVKEGFIFEGWYTEDGSWFNFNTHITRNITLTAYWSKPSYIVTFDSYGGSYFSTQYVEHGHRAERPEPPVKEGFIFEGWHTEDGGWFDFNTPITRNITLTAYWYERWYTVKFDSNGGSHVSTQSVEYGNMAERPEPPVKEGFTFEGWYTEDGGWFNFNTSITSDITLYAQWTKIADTPSNDGRPAGSKDLTTNESLNGTWKLTDGYGYENHPLYGLEEYKTMDALAEMFNGMVYDYYHDSNSKHDNSWSFFDANFCRAITSVEAKGLFTYLKNQIAAMQSYGDGWIVINNAETRIDIFLHGEIEFIYNGNYAGTIIQEIQFTLEKQ